MDKPEKHIWFPAKTYGWGWGTPCTWQGWVVLVVYLAFIIADVFVFPPRVSPNEFFGIFFGLTLLFCLICWWKGEKPSWRWGDKK